mgnify:CR=1 FL=1
MDPYDCPACLAEMLPQVSVGRSKDVPQMHGIWFCQHCGFQEDAQNSPIRISEDQYLAALEAVLPLTQMHGELTQAQRREVAKRAMQLNHSCRDALEELFS